MRQTLQQLRTTWSLLRWSPSSSPGFTLKNCISGACDYLVKKTPADGMNDAACDRCERNTSVKDDAPAGTDDNLGLWRSSA